MHRNKKKIRIIPKLWLFKIATPCVALFAISCQSSFDKLDNLLNIEFNKELRENESSYQTNFQNLLTFFTGNQSLSEINDYGNEKNYLDYYYRWYVKIKNITNLWYENLGLNSKIQNWLQNEEEVKNIGYFANNEFVNLNQDYEWLISSLTYDTTSNNQNKISNQVQNLFRLNNEINTLFNDFASRLKNQSPFNEYKNIFLPEGDFPSDWPFFKSQGTEASDLENYFFDKLIEIAENLEIEYDTKIFDKEKINFDYSKLGSTGSSDGSYGHSHAVINIWREWKNNVYLYKSSDSEYQAELRKNNKYLQMQNFVNQYFAQNQNNYNLVLVNSQNEVIFELNQFMTNLKETLLNNRLPEIEINPINKNVILDFKQPMDKFEENVLYFANALLKRAKSITLLIKNYRSS